MYVYMLVRACVRVCVYIHTYKYVYIHTHTRARTHARTHTNTRTHARTHARTHTHTHTHIFNVWRIAHKVRLATEEDSAELRLIPWQGSCQVSFEIPYTCSTRTIIVGASMHGLMVVNMCVLWNGLGALVCLVCKRLTV